MPNYLKHHKELNEKGEGKCSVAMWAGGFPNGFCDKVAYGFPEGRNGGYDLLQHVPYLACHMHGGPKHNKKESTIYEEVPVDPETFFTSPDYIGYEANIYPILRNDLIKLFKGNYTEVILTGAVGWGKHYLAILIAHRILYVISCLKHPSLAYGLLKESPLFFSIPARNKVLDNLIRILPFFRDKFPLRYLNGNKINLPKNISFGGGSLLGKNVFSAVIDETNLPSSQAEMTYTHYTQLKNRIRSRFMETYDTLPGMLITISHAKNQPEFIKRKIADAPKNPKIYIMNYALWEVAPEGFYGEEKFWISIDVEGQGPKLIEDKDTADNERNKGIEILEVPLEFLQAFKRDTAGALRDIAGRDHTCREVKMKKSIKELLEEYFEYLGTRIDKGEVSSLSRIEELSLESFAEWCDEKLADDK